LVKLDGLADRPAPFLSGGQQQRLALARALVAEPNVLLLDEPLSNLDAKLREEMRFELAELVKRLHVTTLFVTHEQIEALTMSDRMAVMNDGVIVQEGSPTDIYAEPQGSFVADFIGKTNFLEGSVVRLDTEANAPSARVETPIGSLSCRVSNGTAVGDPVKVAVRPENVALSAPGTAAPENAVEGRVETVVFLGNLLDCAVDVDGYIFHVQLHPTAAPPLGSQVQLHLPSEHLLAMRS
jgi:iron(III) transport system ATP-binding protein